MMFKRVFLYILPYLLIAHTVFAGNPGIVNLPLSKNFVGRGIATGTHSRDSDVSYTGTDGVVQVAQGNRSNLWEYSDPADDTGLTASDVTIGAYAWPAQPTALDSNADTLTNAVTFGDNSAQREISEIISIATGTWYIASCYIVMDDGSEPVVGNSSTVGDFCILNSHVVGNDLINSSIHIGNNVYLVSVVEQSVTTGNKGFGVKKYTTQSSKGFKVSGFQVEELASGMEYGDELVTNGTFNADITSWSNQNASLLWEAGTLEITSTLQGQGAYQDNISCTSGQWYCIEADVVFDTVTEVGIRVYEGGAFATLLKEATATSSKKISIVVQATSSAFRVYVRHYASGIANWDNVSLKEIPNYTDLLPRTYTATEGSSATIPGEIPIGSNGMPIVPGFVVLNEYCNFDEFTNDNITPVQNATGPDGEENSAWTLTATDANGTSKYSVTASDTYHNFAVGLKRKTGTGDIDLTIDNGSNWTTKTLTTAWQLFDITASGANPVIGIRIVTSGDEVYAWYPNVVNGKVPLSPGIYTNGSQVAVAEGTYAVDITSNTALRDALSDSDAADTDGESVFTMIAEIVPGCDFVDYGSNGGAVSCTESANSLLRISAATDSFSSSDGTNTPAGPLTPTRGTKYYAVLRADSTYDGGTGKLQVSAATTLAGLAEAGAHGTPTAYDGSFTLGNTLYFGYDNDYPFTIKNVRVYNYWVPDNRLPEAFRGQTQMLGRIDINHLPCVPDDYCSKASGF